VAAGGLQEAGTRVSTTIEAATRLLRGRTRATREIVTPEGVTLTVELADFGERATAFMLDLFFWFCGSLLVFLTFLLLMLRGWAGIFAISILLFITFIIRNCYFIYFELSWRGMTPGKRIAGIRVIDRQGGPLLPSAIVARNFTREIEMFIPLGVLISLSGTAGTIPWERLTLAGWLLSFVALIFVTRDRMRAGDLIAGTVVIALPRQRLLDDLVMRQARFVFTDRQLKAYGAFELQVLEDLLRRPDAPGAQTLLQEVCTKICRKIDWREPVGDHDCVAFLRDFYTAQRAFLEREQLFGRKRADKHDGGTAR
jgi:uncharacterized RDD family membrane protein YckC